MSRALKIIGLASVLAWVLALWTARSALRWRP